MITAFSRSIKGEQERVAPHPGLRFRSILVATDYTQASATAVKLAARLAKQFHAELYVLHSIVPELYAVDFRGQVPELETMDLRAAHQCLHQYAVRIPELRTVKHKELVYPGSVSEAIQWVRESHEVDLLVLGSHGRRGLAKLTLGSVAEWAIRRLHHPVLVAGPTCEKSLRPVRSVLLATDLGHDASHPIHYAASIAQDHNARLTLLHVPPAEHTAEEQAAAELSAKQKLQQLLPAAGLEGCLLQFEVRSGEITSAILHSARENKANLIVLGASHGAPLADHMPRTKLSEVIRGSVCPVLVVPVSAT